MKRILPLILVLTLAACGDTEDPSNNNGNTTNNQPDQGNNNQPDMNNTTDMNTVPDQGTSMDMSTTPDMDMNTMPDQGMDMNNGIACGIDDRFITMRSELGQAGIMVQTNNTLATDAGLDKVWAEINRLQMTGGFPADDPNTMGTTECSGDVMLAEPITITGAVVSGVGFTAGTFIQDKNHGMILRPPTTAYPMMNVNGEMKPVFPKVGDKLNFKVTAVKRFACHTPQISQITDYQVVSEKNPVHTEVITNQEITLATHSYKMIQVGGQLSNPRECGRRMSDNRTFIGRCFDLSYGPEGAKKIITVRTESDFACLSSAGKCGTYMGPVTAFPGIFADTPMIQLNAVNFSWFSPGFTEEACPNFDK